MIPVLIGAAVVGVAYALSDNDNDKKSDKETVTKRTLSENELPPWVKQKLEKKRRT